ncbi:DoxX family protein [Spirosoma horti]
MTSEQKKSTLLTVALWLAQVLLAVSLIWAASMKLFQPVDQLAAMWPWTADHTTLVKQTGVVDLLAGIGLVLPALLRIRPKLTSYAAYGIIALMVAASVFHIARGEASQSGVNIVFALLAIFIAWGRRAQATVTTGD